MRTTKILCLIALALTCQASLAQQDSSTHWTPFGKLRMHIENLRKRIELLEANAPIQEVEGRSYCMMVNVILLRGTASDATEVVETTVVRRVATFQNGVFSAPLAASMENVQDDNGVVLSVADASPPLLEGSYSQTGSQLTVQLPGDDGARWYVSRDGSIIHNNNADFLGPFPNTLSIGIVRSATLVESTSCEF